MKVISFKGGLGNQIFEYFFYMYLKEENNEKINGYYNKKWLRGHNGLEIEKVFEVELPKATYFSDIVVFFLRILGRLFKNNQFVSRDGEITTTIIYYDGWWQNKRFYGHDDKLIKFRIKELDERNKQVLREIRHTNSVALHVRRGDYLKEQFIGKYGGVCTIEYYKKAIDIIKGQFQNPKFFIFSDDFDWVKENFILENSAFIDFNQGEKSYLDMYLMTQCKANIIANSSFSYWGAYLNKECPTVIYPKGWFNNDYYVAPSIFKDEWIGI